MKITRWISGGLLIGLLSTLLPLTALAESTDSTTETDKEPYYISIRWGAFDAENTDLPETDWDGSINLEGDMLGHVVNGIGFEFKDSVIPFTSDRFETNFTSSIYHLNDGLLLRVRADLDDEETPTVTFTADYLDSPIEVVLEDIVNSDEALTEYDDGTYQVQFNHLTRDDWYAWLEDNVALTEFSEVLQEIIALDILTEEKEEELDELAFEMFAVRPIVFNALRLQRLTNAIDEITAELWELIEADASADEILAVLRKAKAHFKNFSEKLHERITDGNKGSWYWNYLTNVVDLGYFDGYRDADGNLTGEIGPSHNITRFQALKVAANLANNSALGYGTYDCEVDTVTETDLDWMGDHWATGYVQCLNDYEAASGNSLTLLDIINEDLDAGKQKITRAEIVMLFFEILEVTANDYDVYSFDDLENSGLPEETKDFIQMANDLEIIAGYGNRVFGPNKFVNRAEAFKIVMLFTEVYES